MRRSSLSYTLAQEILEFIRDQHLGQGDPLPNAKTLAAHFGVTVPTLREGLRALEATGAVELRHGSGTYVGVGIGRLVLPNPNGLDLTGDVRVQLIDARIAIEPQIAELAAGERADRTDLPTLEASLESSDWAQLVSGEPQLNFHRELARVSGNTVLYEVMDSLLSLRSREHREIRRMYDRRRDHAQHKAIFAAVRDRNPARACTLMQIHLNDIRAALTSEAFIPEEHVTLGD